MTGDERLDYITRLVRHRVPEATDEDLAALKGEGTGNPGAIISAEIGAEILEVLDAMAERLDAIAPVQLAEP